eukprot:scaffold343071_cov39-Prasinocladus_malaysianus.AAC.1
MKVTPVTRARTHPAVVKRPQAVVAVAAVKAKANASHTSIQPIYLRQPWTAIACNLVQANGKA